MTLNMRSAVFPVIEGKTVITASEPASDEKGVIQDGMAPYEAGYRRFYEKVVPDSMKDFDERLQQGLPRKQEEMRKQTLPWAREIFPWMFLSICIQKRDYSGIISGPRVE